MRESGIRQLLSRHTRRVMPRQDPAQGHRDGTPVAKGIVEAHGGHIWIEDRRKGGDASRVQPSDWRSGNSARTITGCACRPGPVPGDELMVLSQQQRILIVDDESQIARVLRTGLKTHGYEVRVAADGVSALETFSDWHPDLVVTDLAMPNMDGLDLCRRLRATHNFEYRPSVRAKKRSRSSA